MILKIDNLKKTFHFNQQKIEILKGVSLSVDAGESVAILGKSGSGKSTLLSLLAGLDEAESGSIFFENKNLSKLNEKEKTTYRAQKIGIIFQQFHLFSHLTALENVTLPLEILGRWDEREKAQELLSEVGLSHRLDHRPSQLSGGEKQRVAMARALVTAPTLILADEPSGSLDEETGGVVMDLLFKLTEKKTALILVTHEVEYAKKCARICHLEHGVLRS